MLFRLGLLCLFVSIGAGCTAVQRVPDREPKAYLKLQVEPTSTEVYVDGEYRGTVDGWVEGAVPLEPGEHRLKLTADGYITRRFDIEIDAGRSKVLELEMEPELETPSADTGTSRSPGGPPQSPLEGDGPLPGDRRSPDAGTPGDK